VLENQYIEQIDDKVRKAIFGNCGTIVSFKVGAQDAEWLVKEIGTFAEEDFCNLPSYHIYLRLMIDGIAGNAFSAITLPPLNLGDTEMNAKKIIRVSRERYATKRCTVEEKANK
jgi:hypothetical protein